MSSLTLCCLFNILKVEIRGFIEWLNSLRQRERGECCNLVSWRERGLVPGGNGIGGEKDGGVSWVSRSRAAKEGGNYRGNEGGGKRGGRGERESNRCRDFRKVNEVLKREPGKSVQQPGIRIGPWGQQGGGVRHEWNVCWGSCVCFKALLWNCVRAILQFFNG